MDDFCLSRRLLLMAMGTAPMAACEKTPPMRPKPTRAPVAPASIGLRQKFDDLVELVRLDPTIRLDIRYATPDNIAHHVLYSSARAFLVRVAAEALLRAHKRARAEGFGLTIFDAYRPWHVTKALWDATPRAQRGYVADPKKGSKHNRGCAVDLSLHDLKSGALVEMPSAYDDLSYRAHRNFADASAQEIANRKALEGYLEAEGFRGISNEWWHFDFAGWQKFPIQDIAFEEIGG